MATPVMGSPVKKVYGETVSLTTTAAHLLFMPAYHEVMMYCSNAWRMGIAPRLARVKYYNGSTYTDHTSKAIDRAAATHVPLDAMAATHYLYLGVVEPVRGFYFNLDDTNKNDEAATLDWEYMYDIATVGYIKLTGTAGAAFAVGLTTTGGTSGATGVTVYDGTSYVILKTTTGKFSLGETITDSSTGSMTVLSAIDPVASGTGYFTDVASDSDGTDVAGDTLKQDGLYSFTLPSVVRGALAGVDAEPLHWYRFNPSATLSATVDLIDIIPACEDVNYAYMEGATAYQFALNVAQAGAFEFDHASTGTLDISWLKH